MSVPVHDIEEIFIQKIQCTNKEDFTFECEADITRNLEVTSIPLPFQYESDHFNGDKPVFPTMLGEIFKFKSKHTCFSADYIIFSHASFYRKFNVIHRSANNEFFMFKLLFPREISKVYIFKENKAFFISYKILYCICLPSTFTPINNNTNNNDLEFYESSIQYRILEFESVISSVFLQSVGFLHVLLSNFLVILDESFNKLKIIRLTTKFYHVIAHKTAIFLFKAYEFAIFYNFVYLKTEKTCLGGKILDVKYSEFDNSIIYVTRLSIQKYSTETGEYLSYLRPVSNVPDWTCFKNKCIISLNEDYVCLNDCNNAIILLDSKSLNVIEAKVFDFAANLIFISKSYEYVIISTFSITIVKEIKGTYKPHEEKLPLTEITFDDLLAKSTEFLDDEPISIDGIDLTSNYVCCKVNNSPQELYTKNIDLLKIPQDLVTIEHYKNGNYKIVANYCFDSFLLLPENIPFFNMKYFDWFEKNYEFNQNREKEEIEEGDFNLYNFIHKYDYFE